MEAIGRGGSRTRVRNAVFYNFYTFSQCLSFSHHPVPLTNPGGRKALNLTHEPERLHEPGSYGYPAVPNPIPAEFVIFLLDDGRLRHAALSITHCAEHGAEINIGFANYD